MSLTDIPKFETSAKQNAIELFLKGDLMGAKALCEQVICGGDRDPETHCLLGAISGKLGYYENAIKHSRRAIELCPNYVAAYSNLLQALTKTDNMRGVEGVVSGLQSIISQHQEDGEVYLQLGNALKELGRYEEALHAYRAASRVNPQSLEGLAGEATIYEHMGDPEKAHALIQRHLSDKPVNLTIAILYGNLARRLNLQKDAIRLLSSVLESEFTDGDALSSAHFILGALYDSLGCFDEAFEHYREGNQLQPVYFDRFRHARIVEQLIARFSCDKIGAAVHSGIKSNRPIFVVGMPRSGTSLVEQILSTHPEVYGAGELDDIAGLVWSMPGAVLGSRELSAEELERCARTYLEKLDRLGGNALHVVDKMPHNFLYLGFIQLLFPECQIIHCRRDPLDTCLSCYFQAFNAHLAYSSDLESLGFYYRTYEAIMAHWKKVLSIPIYDVVYEDLVSNPETEIRKLLDTCKLQWYEGCLEYHTNARIVRTASYDQVRQPIYRSSVRRWRNYRHYLQPLVDSLSADAPGVG